MPSVLCNWSSPDIAFVIVNGAVSCANRPSWGPSAADTLVATPGRELPDVGASYVRFALAYPAHFEVMFRPDLYHADDPDLDAARRRSSEALRTAGAHVPHAEGDVALTGLAAWSIAHGFATLWASGGLARTAGGREPIDLFRACASVAFTTVHKGARR